MSTPLPPPIIVVAGPTASGKSALALDVACEFGGCVINADSMQIYSELHVLTARPSAQDMAQAPHRLYGILSAHDVCSADRWARLAAAEIADCRAHGLIPVVTGGTGLYLRALIDGLSPMPAIPDDVRLRTRALLAEVGNERFHTLLAERDPAIASHLNVGDSQRLARAFEVFEASGQSILYWQARPANRVVEGRFLTIVIEPPRPLLYEGIERRFDVMMSCGALAEVRGLLATRPPADAPLMKALGVPELAAHLRGDISLDEAITKAKQMTRNFAKRQCTWFKGQIISNKLVGTQYSESLRHEIFALVRQFLLTTAH
mgnify:CR=1 FL=1